MYVSVSKYPVSMYLCIQYLYIYICIYVSGIYLSIYYVYVSTFCLSEMFQKYACSRWRWERQQNLLFPKLTHLSSSFFHLVFIFSFNTCRDGRPWAVVMLNIVAPCGPGKTHPPANNAAEVKHSAVWMEKHSSCTTAAALNTPIFLFFGGGGEMKTAWNQSDAKHHQGNWWKVECLFGLGVTCGVMNERSSLHMWWMFAFEPGFPNCAERNRHGPVWMASVRIWADQLERGNV